MSNPKPKQVGDITEADWSQWKHHPVTKVFLKYLEDYRTTLRRDHVERWEAGDDDAKTEAEARGRVLAVKEMKDLSFDDLFAFYSEPKADTELDSERSDADDAG